MNGRLMTHARTAAVKVPWKMHYKHVGKKVGKYLFHDFGSFWVSIVKKADCDKN